MDAAATKRNTRPLLSREGTLERLIDTVTAAVNGSRSNACGGFSAKPSIRANVWVGTAFLSSGIGSPPSATWKTPAVVRLSLAGLCSTPLRTRYELTMSELNSSRSGGNDSARAMPWRSSTKVWCGNRTATPVSCRYSSRNC